MDELVLVGKTVSTHGIKGEIKVISDFEYKDKAFLVGKKVMINNQIHSITSIRYHKQYILMTIDDLYDINDILKYVGYNVYIKRSDLNLKESEYLLRDLIGKTVFLNDLVIGEVIEVVNGVNCNYIRVSSKKDFLIPLIDVYVLKIDDKGIHTKDTDTLMI